MWSVLKTKQLGVKSRRQVPVGPYVVDFLCEQERLIIELDGSQHVERKEYDEGRTEYLRSRGYEVIRFWDSDVFRNLDGVLYAIREKINTRRPHSALRAPRPLGEETN